MPAQFDLLREPIVPVLRSDQKRVWVRLADIADPHEGHTLLRVDSGRADCDTSLTEFLIGLLAVTLDPVMTKVGWLKRWRAPPAATELETAFAPFAGGFLLDGPGARFFQDLDDLDGGAETPVGALFMDAPAEHFVKPGGTVALSRRGAALALLTLQTNAPAGGAGHRTSLRGGGPLTTLVVPGPTASKPTTLWQRLWANVPERFGATAADISSVFPWFGPTRTSERGSKTETTTSLDVHKAQAFFGMPRRIRLVFQPNDERLACALTGEIDGMIVRHYRTKPWGTNYVGWGRDHPLSPCYRSRPNQQYLPEHLKSARIGYRDWLGYVFRDQTDASLPAAAIPTFRETRADDLLDIDKAIIQQARISAAGYVLDKMKPLEYGEALLPFLALPRTAKEEDRGIIVEKLSELAHGFVAAAEHAATVLSAAVRKGLYGDAPKVSAAATTLDTVKARLWADTEHAFFDAMRAAPETIVRNLAAADSLAEALRTLNQGWLQPLRRAGLAIFDDTVPIDSAGDRSPDAYRQIVDARSQLVAAFAGQTSGGRKMYEALHLQQVTRQRRGRTAA